MASIVSLQVGKPQLQILSGAHFNTAINKKPVISSFVTMEEMKGDGIGNRKHHGGPDRVVCFYPFEHYAMWESLLGKRLPIPAFGENLTVKGMTEEQVYLGDIYRIGESLVQISQGRIPCATISYFNREPEFLKKVIETSRTGYFARVIEEGTICKSDTVELVERIQEEVSVLYGNEIYFHDKDGLEGLDKLLGIEVLADVWKSKAARKRNIFLQDGPG